MRLTRRLALPGLYNARDLGGFPAADGSVTRFGVFVRSEAPCDLPEETIQGLLDYGVGTSMDLRGSGETNARPSELRERMPYFHKPLFNEAVVYDKNRGHNGPPPHGGPGGKQDWGEMYKSMAEESREWAKEALQIAADCEGALLYHCTTGKDRTGLLTCYLLSIAGVGRADIAADYCVSQVFLEPVYHKMRTGAMRLGPVPKDLPKEPGGPGGPMMDEAFFRTPAEAMLTLIDYLTERYGGVTNYLTEIGVPDETMRAIRKKLIED